MSIPLLSFEVSKGKTELEERTADADVVNKLPTVSVIHSSLFSPKKFCQECIMYFSWINSECLNKQTITQENMVRFH